MRLARRDSIAWNARWIVILEQSDPYKFAPGDPPNDIVFCGYETNRCTVVRQLRCEVLATNVKPRRGCFARVSIPHASKINTQTNV